MYFIWYYQVNLQEDWKEIKGHFNQQFEHAERNIQGIQCKFYHFIKDKNYLNVQEQQYEESAYRQAQEKCRVVQFCGLWFPWMKAEHTPSEVRLVGTQYLQFNL